MKYHGQQLVEVVRWDHYHAIVRAGDGTEYRVHFTELSDVPEDLPEPIMLQAQAD